MTVKTAIDGVRTGLDLLRNAIGLVKESKDLMAEGDKKNVITKTLEQADSASKLAEAQIAQALGYQLCQCTFPPQIMLSVGRHHRGDEIFKCGNCGKQEPAEQYFSNREILVSQSRAEIDDFY